MKLRRSALTAALAVTGVLVGAAPAHTEPGQSPPVSYQAALVEKSVVTTLDHGTFALQNEGGAVAVRDAAGEVLDTVPLTYSLDGQRLALRHEISHDGRTLTITPDTTGLDRAALRPVASPLENQLAMNDLINAVSISTSLGTLVGTAVGAIAGIGVGIVLSGAACAVLSLGCVVAVLPIMSLTAGVGGIAGLILAGGPAGIAAAFEYVTTLNAPPGGSKYAEQTQGKPGGPPAGEAPR
ncbi:hypothetical protein [Nocardia farcinica]|uniref:DUF8020 domain-containing protein n=1 Tax=Nocardia farcinica (strain IFM 10152) TaxID=247156 RepID=Q5YU90_NOCFA|nr:hypothetical protein [Nocardia farcinica]BAD58251.1 hypothetical protein NFA_34040 [Nocardia farcinica IFM 10152]